jgi:5-dehydro-2-deoxygluconokinase
MDLDLRPTEWADPRDYGRTLRSVFPLVDVLIGTEDEFFAALSVDPDAVVARQALADGDHEALEGLLERLHDDGTVGTIVIKRGPRGVTVLSAGDRMDVPAFPVEAVNTVGAGDAFASGLIHGRSAGWDWYRAARFANACGAIQVTRHGCSAAFPTEAEVEAFVEAGGGL